MHRQWRQRRLALVAALALAVVTGCGDSDDGDIAAGETEDEANDAAGDQDGEAAGGELDALIAAAEQEGRLSWYSVPAASIAEGISDEFSSRYDIDVEFIRLVSSDLEQRYSSEAEAGAPAADLILTSNSPFLADAFDRGWLTPLNEANLPDYGEFPEEFLVRDGQTAIVSINPTVIGYNTDLVDEEPTDWTVLSDPAWEGRIAISDPKTSIANVFFWDLIRKEYGDELLAEIATNDPTFTPGAVPSAQGVGAGEFAFGVPAVSAIYDNIAGEGAPVAYGAPEITTGSEIAVGISTEAENPNAARLFAHFILTREGNELLNLPYNTASAYGTNLPSGYQRPDESAAQRAEEIYELLGAD